MSMLGNMASGAKNAVVGVGKILIPKKREKPPEIKGHYQESADEYAKRLMARRSRRY